MCASSTVTASADEFEVEEETLSLWSRIAANPEPAAKWTAVALVLLAVEFGAAAKTVLILADSAAIGVTGLLDALAGVVSSSAAQVVTNVQTEISDFLVLLQGIADQIPTLLSRSVIPNEGYKAGPNGPWKGTFLGLQPALAWFIRVALIFAYSFFCFYWLFKGWLVFREHYRAADWTPRDDVVDRLRGHRWGEFGIVVVVSFLTIAIFAPALGPTTVDQNIKSPYSHKIKYFSEESGKVESVFVGKANFNSKSKGAGDQNVGPLSYDNFRRFHPFGTLTNGRDLFTVMMAGARTTLIVAGLAILFAGGIALILSLLSAYYKGVLDLATVMASDATVSIPQLILLMLVMYSLQDHWFALILDRGLVIAIVLGLTSWPFLWRSFRPPALQVSGEEWVDAAKSFGQRPRTTMRKHMLPYVAGYVLVYGSMTVGGFIISLAALSFIGFGILPPTPSWGRAIALGQPYVSTQSWHIATLPGIMIVVFVTGLNAFGDGIRDAIDPESEAGDEEGAAAGGAAG